MSCCLCLDLWMFRHLYWKTRQNTKCKNPFCSVGVQWQMGYFLKRIHRFACGVLTKQMLHLIHMPPTMPLLYVLKIHYTLFKLSTCVQGKHTFFLCKLSILNTAPSQNTMFWKKYICYLPGAINIACRKQFCACLLIIVAVTDQIMIKWTHMQTCNAVKHTWHFQDLIQIP